MFGIKNPFSNHNHPAGGSPEAGGGDMPAPQQRAPEPPIPTTDVSAGWDNVAKNASTRPDGGVTNSGVDFGNSGNITGGSPVPEATPPGVEASKPVITPLRDGTGSGASLSPEEKAAA